MRKFSGSGTCCACETSCNNSCGCDAGPALAGLRLPDQMVLSDLLLPVGNTIEYRTGDVILCEPPGGVPGGEDPLDYSYWPYDTYSSRGHQAIQDVIGTRILASESVSFNGDPAAVGHCVYGADVNVPVPSNWSGCWDQTSYPRVVTKGAYISDPDKESWGLASQLPDAASRVYDPFSDPNALNELSQTRWAGLRRVEWVVGYVGSSYNVTVNFIPQEIWIPYVSNSFYQYFLDHVVKNNAARYCTLCEPSMRQWWDGVSIEKLAWDSPYNDLSKSFKGPVMELESTNVLLPTTTSSGFDFAWPRLGMDMLMDASGTTTMCFNAWDGTNPCSPSCTNRTDTFYQDTSGTLNMDYSSICWDSAEPLDDKCWSNAMGGGCFPIAKQGMPDNVQPFTGFSCAVNGVTWTQNGDSYWEENSLLCPVTNGTPAEDRIAKLWNDDTLRGITETGYYLGLSLYVPFGTLDDYLLIMDKCDGLVTALCTAEPTLLCTFTFAAGEGCDECNPDPPAYGCCILADGTTTLATGQAQCEGPMGGTYSGDGVECPPVGCCALIGSPDLSDVTEAHCTTQGGVWTEATDCNEAGYCQDPITGVVTPDVEENDCTGNWSATPFPTGCCVIIGSPDQSGKNEIECSVLGGTWTEGASCGPLGWCIDDTTGAITPNVEENDCTGTWSATEPTSGCCTIGGTQNPDVAQSWCTAQSGSFVAGACPTNDFDPTTSSRIVVNSLTLDAPDPSMNCSDNFEMTINGLPSTGSYTTALTKSRGLSGKIEGGNFEYSDPTFGTQITSSSAEVVFDNVADTFVVKMTINWAYGSSFGFVATTAAAPISGIGTCPSFTLSGTFDSIVDGAGKTAWTQNCNSQTTSDLVGSYNITVECQ